MKTPRVLVVDDSPYVTRAVVRALKRHGYDVIAAHSGEEVRALEGDFELGVFDGGLEGESGINLAEHLLSEGRVRQVVFLTGGLSPVRHEAAEKIGSVLQKSDGIEVLAEYVDSALRGHRVASDVAPAPCGALG